MQKKLITLVRFVVIGGYQGVRFTDGKKDYLVKGETGLINSKPCPENPAVRVDPFIEEKILYLRKNYHFGQAKMSLY